MRFRIVETCNFGKDYPQETFLPIPGLSQEDAAKVARIINDASGPRATRYWKVVPWDYELDTEEFQP